MSWGGDIAGKKVVSVVNDLKVNLLKRKAMATVLDKELLQYVTQLNEPQKKSLLEMIKSFLKSEDDAAENNSLAQYNQDLDEAMSRIDKGSFTTLDALEKEAQVW